MREAPTHAQGHQASEVVPLGDSGGNWRADELAGRRTSLLERGAISSGFARGDEARVVAVATAIGRISFCLPLAKALFDKEPERGVVVRPA